jgi:anthranilate phosphoribosyltransferase
MSADPVERFAAYVAILGRGPGRSRVLTREEADDAMRLLLAGGADPVQIGAFLMLLRYRGEDVAEIAGLVDGARTRMRLPGVSAALDWPSYGGGRTRGQPWYLLAAMALGKAGWPVLMHGTNEFSGGTTVLQALAKLRLAPAKDADGAARDLETRGFAYVPVERLSFRFAGLLGLRRLLGLRSPMNTVARLLNPADAPAGVDGVFHPAYIDIHIGAAALLGRQRLLVLKGGGGEAERNPSKDGFAYLLIAGGGRSKHALPGFVEAAPGQPEPPIEDIWRGSVRNEAIEARVVATIALGLMAMGKGGYVEAQSVWENRGASG